MDKDETEISDQYYCKIQYARPDLPSQKLWKVRKQSCNPQAAYVLQNALTRNVI